MRQQGCFSIFLDFDGLQKSAFAEGCAVLERLARKSYPVAAVTGLRIEVWDSLAAGAEFPVIGNYGTEIRMMKEHAGYFRAPPLDSGLRVSLQGLQERYLCRVEDKVTTVTVHLPGPKEADEFRLKLESCMTGPFVLSQRPASRERKNLEKEIEDLLHGFPALSLIRTGHALEIVQTYFSKGAGIRYLMELPPFRGSMPVYIGKAHAESGTALVEKIGGKRFLLQKESGGFSRGELGAFLESCAGSAG
jgi:trehalose-6-phosphatase